MAATRYSVPVLVADDEDMLRESMRMVLEDAGYMVREASDGPTTLAVLRSSAESLVVLLDLVMPQHGQDVLEAISADTLLATRHVYIVCTARLGSGGQLLPTDAGRLEGMLAPTRRPLRLVTKPFDIDTLLAAVDEAAVAVLTTARSPDTSDSRHARN